MRFKEDTFGSLYAEPVRNGLTRPTAVRGEGYRMVNMGELFAYDQIAGQPMERVQLNHRELQVATLEPGDLLFARSSLKPEGVGKCSIVASLPEVTTFESHLIRARLDRSRADPRFYFYFFHSYYGRAAVQSIAKQVGAAGLPGSKLAGLLVPRPAAVEQTHIADVLAAYDDLINNNRRRIKLLEDSVRLLFDEWFVSASASNWPTSTLQQLCVDDGGIQTGPFGSQLHQADYSEEGVPVVMPKDLTTMRIDTRTIARIPEHLADELGRHRMQRGDVVFGRRGEIGRRAYIGQRQIGYFCGTGCLRLRPDPARVHPRFLFEILRAPAVAGDIANRAKGSTMANLSAGALQGVPVPVPPRELQDRFATFADDVGEQIDTLDEQSRKLRTARDLLLPRLMSGELSV